MPALLLLAIVLCSMTSRAGAEEHEVQLSLEPLYGFLYADPPSGPLVQRGNSGGGGALHLSYGLTDTVALRLSGEVTGHSAAADPGTVLAWNVSAGVVYALDVVRIVPFFEAGLALLGLNDHAGTQLHLGLGLGLGGDYLITRRWAVGVALRYHFSLTHPSQVPLYLVAGPRVTVRF